MRTNGNGDWVAIRPDGTGIRPDLRMIPPNLSCIPSHLRMIRPDPPGIPLNLPSSS